MKRFHVLALVACATLAGFALAQTGNRPATIVVRVPGEATVTISGEKTTQRGTERRYTTPDLAAGTYSYEIEARWDEGGKEVKEVKTVRFTPGQTATVDFTGGKVVTTISGGVIGGKTTKKSESEPKLVKVEKKAATEGKGARTKAGKSRTFLFTYGGTVKDLKPGEQAKIWLPVPVNTAEQTIAIDKKELPGPEKIGKENQYGNTILYVEGKANDKGEIPFKITYKVTRQEVKTDIKANAVLKPKEPESKIMRFLQPDAKVPVDGKPLDLLKENLKGQKLPGEQYAAAKVLYDVVNTHMKYSKEGKGWGQGDSVWACDSKFGNCTDFHSLFISMARGSKIPSKFEMGFPIPPKRGDGIVGGYHCWAWFLPDGKGWVPVDISEANRFPEMREYYFGNLTEDRVQFTTGRDIDLAPRQDGPALNFFIYPYVEVNGTAYPADKVARAFAYQDL